MFARTAFALAFIGCGQPDPTSVLVDIDASGLFITTGYATIVTGNRADVCDRRSLAGSGREVVLPGKLVVLLPDGVSDAYVTLTGETAGGCRVSAAGRIGVETADQSTLKLQLETEYPATCCDGDLSGDETARDCGGSCPACDLATGPPVWRAAPPMMWRRDEHAAVAAPDGRIYVLGGASPDLPDNLDSIESIDPVAEGEWREEVTRIPPARWGLAAAVLGDTLYAAGGEASPTENAIQATLDAITPGGAVTSRAPMSTPRRHFGLIAGLDGALYAIGGAENATSYLDTVETYLPEANTWSPVRLMPDERRALGVARGDDGLIYAIGGETPAGHAATATVYSPAADRWSPIASMTLARAKFGAATGSDGRIYAIAGEDQSTLHDGVEAYTPRSDRWSPVTPITPSRYLVAAATGCDGRLYAIGGVLNAPYEPMVSGYGPVVTVQPPVAPSGASVRVRGDNFAADATVRAYFGVTAGGDATAGVTDSLGNLMPIDLIVPDVGPGFWPITVVDDRSLMPVTTLVEVTR